MHLCTDAQLHTLYITESIWSSVTDRQQHLLVLQCFRAPYSIQQASAKLHVCFPSTQYTMNAFVLLDGANKTATNVLMYFTRLKLICV